MLGIEEVYYGDAGYTSSMIIYDVDEGKFFTKVSCVGTNFIPHYWHNLAYFQSENSLFLGYAYKYYCQSTTVVDCLMEIHNEVYHKVITDPVSRVVYHKPLENQKFQHEMPLLHLKSPIHPDGEDMGTFQSCRF